MIPASARAELRDALLRGDRDRALELLRAQLAQAVSAAEVLTGLLAPAVAEVGDLWHAGRVSVADEHLATHTAWACVESLRGSLPRVPPHGLGAVVACPEGDHHGLGARVMAELLHLDGWQVAFLGANTPAEALVDYAARVGAALVVIGVTVTDAREGATRAAEGLRALPSPPLVIVGGPAVRPPDRELGADLAVSDAPTALQAARRLVGVAPEDTLARYLEALGDRLRHLRRAAGLSQQALAERAGLDRTYVSAIERGRQNVTLAAVLRLAEALGVAPTSLLGEP